MTTIAAKKQENRLPLTTWIILVIVGLGGIGIAWGMQLVQGMGVTGLNQRIVWGLYIAGFFSALGAGAALVALTAVNEFATFAPLSMRRKALSMALASFVVGGLLITMDVGIPTNLWRIITAGRFTSMMTWDFWALAVTGILSLVYLLVGWREKNTSPVLRTLGILASISGVMLVVVEGWMLSTMVARPLWEGGLTVVSFLLAAAIAGLALALFVWTESQAAYRRWLVVGLWASLALVIIEMLTAVLGAQVRPQAEVFQLLSGSFSPMFWIYLVGGLGLPLAILLWQSEQMWLRAAAFLAFLGVIVDKLWMLVAGQAMPWLALPEASYSPTWIELLGLVGCLAFGVLIYQILLIVFPPAASEA